VDLQTAVALYEPIRQAFSGHPVVAESGYTCGQELQTIADLGYDAVLIGEGLVDDTRDVRAWFVNQSTSQA
jgi:indole-3-glycerol phosphate synthase